MWEIKGKDNQTKAIPSTKPEYNGEWMGESYVTVSVESPVPIDFAIGDYIIYRDERFEINYDPGKIKSAPRDEKGDAFKYENIKFNSLADELTRCDFLDVVLGDNQLHFTGLPKFSFYGGVRDLANRIQANLDRTYGKGTWQVVVSPEYSGTKEINISVDTIKVQGALSILVNDLKTYYTTKERTITIGAAGVPAGHLFKYGKGNGLYEIEQNAEADQAIVTRLRAYGSTRNLPHRYYNSLTGADGQKLIPDNMAVQYLMLPDFPYTTQDPYIDSANKAALGIREGTIFFDGSQEGLEEIYPSIEGMTAEQLKAAGVPCNSTGALDVIVSAEQIEDNGVGEIDGNETKPADGKSTFKVELKDLGFDIWEHRIAGTTPVMSVKTGMLGGRDFEIVACKKIETGGKVTGYELELNRVYDDGIQLWFPYKDYNAKGIEQNPNNPDKFVILHIEMPEVYIKAAAQRLLEAAEAWLAKNDYSRSVYAPKVDEIFMARQHDEAMASGGKIASLHDTLKEGMLLLFEDEDLNINASIFIDRLTIKEEGAVPTYEVVLKEEKTVGRLDKMQNQIDSLASGMGQGGGGYTAAQIRSMIEAYGGMRFLSKIKDDTAEGFIKFLKGLFIGEYIAGTSGGFFGKNENGDSFAEMDRLYVRIKAFFEQLTIIKAGVIAGKQYITPGGGIVCTKVEETDTAYRCWFLSEQDGEQTQTMMEAGDQAISEMFNAKAGTANKVSNHRYWRLVTAVDNDALTDDNGNHYGYLDLSKTDCENGSDIPQAQDEICQFGSRNDTDRQSAMVFSTVDADAPSVKLYNGIDSYSLTGKAIVSFGKDSHSGKVFFRLGASSETFYLEYTQDGGLVVAGRISSKSTIDGTPIDEYIESKAGEAQGVMVQYSVTGADGTWHNTYADGDMFMRQSTDGGATWTDAIPFVGHDGAPGKDGAYHKYQWAKSYLSTLAPTSGWQDTPPTASAGQYIWMRMGMVTPPATEPETWEPAVRLTGDKGSDGTSPYLLDLDNEVIPMVCDADGNVLGSYPAVKATMYKGGSEASSVTYSIAEASGITASVNSSGTVTLGALTADKAYAVVQAKSGTVTLQSRIDIYKVKPGADGDDAVIYDIIPSADNVTRGGDGTPSVSALTCTVYKTVGASRSTSNDYTLTYQRIPDMGAAKTLSRTNGVSAPVDILADTEAVIFELRNGSTILDSERVPVLTDASGLVIGGENLLRNTDYLDGTEYWEWNGTGGGISVKSDAANVYNSRRSMHVANSVYQDVEAQPSTTYTLSGYIKTVSAAGADNEVRVETVIGNYKYILGELRDALGGWTYFKGTFTTAASLSAGEKLRVLLQSTGEFYLNSLKLEKGNTATGWSPSPLDSSYLREALRQDTASMEGGLICGTTMMLGTKGSDGELNVTAGMNGAVKNPSDLAYWSGGKPIDKAVEPDNAEAATCAIRHDGTFYGADNKVRILKDRFEMGSDGQHTDIALIPGAKAMRIYDSDSGEMTQELSGVRHTDPVNRFYGGTQTGPITFTKKDQSAITLTGSYMAADAPVAVTGTINSASNVLSLIMGGGTITVKAESTSGAGNYAEAHADFILQQLDASGNITGEVVVASVYVRAESASNGAPQTKTQTLTLTGKSIASSTPGRFRLAIDYWGMATPTGSISVSWASLSASYGGKVYRSNYFANGYLLGDASDDYLTAYHDGTGMVYEARMGGYGINMSRNGIRMLTAAGNWDRVPMPFYRGFIRAKNGVLSSTTVDSMGRYSINPTLQTVGSTGINVVLPSQWKSLRGGEFINRIYVRVFSSSPGCRPAVAWWNDSYIRIDYDGPLPEEMLLEIDII